MDALAKENTIDSRSRMENLNEFITVAKEFEAGTADGENNGTLSEFLEGLTLAASVDDIDDAEDAVLLMTIHSAKGLEFPVVFLAGLEEGIFPGSRSLSDKESLDEERRLCYVAMTRAQEKLYITKAEQRFIYGKTNLTQPSRFWKEIPEQYIEDMSPKKPKIYEYVHETAKKKPVWSFGTHRTEKKSSGAEKLEPGIRVRHKTFGAGTVLKITSSKSGTVLQVQFDNAGTKALMAEYAKLEII
jgi:DNA helicase-2/ATP-dependent DNA helicase PcrA